ncbi:glyoxylate/hydroxypyruvate reductase A [Breoghania corrubedonensis]|uniref:Glyoxylate/hydroxypyruvate reductase A n=1 Tax=Breoghania corrubedonensis TaxID=665038 RepID=A0A2T5VG12_9HYPH|nr:glyoxylate/hydroxypyruvate reductase A [Breoghania corrubedonensis]PTW62693.1 glyoxylate/hydroxypyruvate reductase A [Breoghania corrubedonensis]
MALLIAVHGWDSESWSSRFSNLLPGHDVRCHPETTGNPAEIRYLLAWKPDSDLLASLTNLEVIFSLGAGVDHLLQTPDLPDVPIVRIVDPDLTMRMSEWIVLQVLLHHRKHRTYHAQQHQRLWQPHDQPAASAVRVGIMGLGVLGRDAATHLSRLGFQVAGWSRSPKEIDGIRSFSGADGLDDMLKRTDILVNLLPLTQDTRGLIDYRLLSKLSTDGKRHPGCDAPVLVNAGRGASQVEADIVRALDDGTLAACSLDVFETEPLPAPSPLWTHPKVYATPHVAADSDPQTLSHYVAERIQAFEAGEGLINVVDRATGY